jgi:hypothetical protein
MSVRGKTMKLEPDQLEALKNAAIQAEITASRADAAKARYEAVIAKLSYIYKTDLSTVPIGPDGTIQLPEEIAPINGKAEDACETLTPPS